MKNVDYIIVGYGIAAACFAKLCVENNKSFLIVCDNQTSASHVAAGMFNPVVLHRFVPVDRAVEYMDQLEVTFREFEDLLQDQFIHPHPIYRIFANQVEAELWHNKIALDPILQKYLNPIIKEEQFEPIHAPFGFGEVRHGGWMDLSGILEGFELKFKSNFLLEDFDFDAFNPASNSYKDIHYQNIVFAEGVKVSENPFFDFVPIIKSKGEIMIIETEEELPDIIFKSKNFLLPLGENKYYVGATYDRNYKSELPTEQGKERLVRALTKYFKGEFKILEHQAALRPTTPDRRGLIGSHAAYSHMHILNGLGTRGTFHGPFLSKNLFEYIALGKPLDKEHDVNRWT